MDQDYFDDVVGMHLSRLSAIANDIDYTFDNEHTSAQKVRKEKQLDQRSKEIKELMRLSILAQEFDLSIPKNLSYFLINHLNAQLYRTQHMELVDTASKHDDSNDSHTKERLYLQAMACIITGHIEAKQAVERPGRKKTQGDLDSFLSGEGSIKYALNAEDYGYLVGINKKKLTVSDAKLFFTLHFHQSPSNISKLFTRHNLSMLLRGYSQ